MKMISVREFSNFTGIKQGQIRDLTFAKGSPCTRIGRRVYIFEDEAQAWIRARQGKTINV